MARQTVARMEVENLVKVLEPEKTGDASSDITLPVTFRARGELQRMKIVIPNDKKVTRHPAFPVAQGIAKKIIPLHSKFKVSGLPIYSAYWMDGRVGLASRLEVDTMERCKDDEADLNETSCFVIKTYETDKDKEKTRKKLAQEVGLFWDCGIECFVVEFFFQIRII